MNRYSGFFLMGILMLAGCSIVEEGRTDDRMENESLEDTYRARLAEILQSDLSQPDGYLIQIRFSASMEGEPRHFTDYYYNQKGERILSVGRNTDADTVGLSFFGYNELGNRIESINFWRQNGQMVWNSTHEFVYNSDNLEIEGYSVTLNGERRLRSQRVYNDNNQLTEIRFDQEAYRYDYDENGQISAERWIVLHSPSNPIRELFYRYDPQNRLEAKDVRYGFEDVPPTIVPLFQYFYDGEERLSESWEFDTSFGITFREKRVYIYNTGQSPGP